MKKRSLIKAVGGFNIFLLGMVSFLNDFSSEMILPILPLFITSLGGAGLSIGLIGGLMQGLPEIFKVFSGYLSDRFRYRKKFIFSGYFISQLGKLSLLLASSPLGVLFSTSVDKLGKGLREAPRDALISESTPREKGKAFGIQRTFDSAGAILGSLTLLLIIIFFASRIQELVLMKRIILIGALLGFASLIPIFFLREGKSLHGKGKNHLGFISTMKELPKGFWVFIGFSIVFAFANFSYMFFVLRAGDIFNHKGDFIIPLIPIALYVLYNISYTIFAIPFGKLSDKIGRKKVLMFGASLLAVVCLGFAFAKTFPLFVILFVLYGIVYATMIGNQRAFVSDLSQDKLRATALGTFQTIVGIGSILAGIISGVLYNLNPTYLFIYGAILAVIYVIGLGFGGKIFLGGNLSGKEAKECLLKEENCYN
jgi:MFS family permease